MYRILFDLTAVLIFQPWIRYRNIEYNRNSSACFHPSGTFQIVLLKRQLLFEMTATIWCPLGLHIIFSASQHLHETGREAIKDLKLDLISILLTPRSTSL